VNVANRNPGQQGKQDNLLLLESGLTKYSDPRSRLPAAFYLLERLKQLLINRQLTFVCANYGKTVFARLLSF
jgi:hypothetical protein